MRRLTSLEHVLLDFQAPDSDIGPWIGHTARRKRAQKQRARRLPRSDAQQRFLPPNSVTDSCPRPEPTTCTHDLHDRPHDLKEGDTTNGD